MKNLMGIEEDGSHSNRFSNAIAVDDNEIPEDLPDETIKPNRKIPFDYTISGENDNGNTLLTATDKFNNEVNR